MFPEWLVHVINSFGNDVHYRSKAVEIKLKGNSVQSLVVDQKGKISEIRCKHIVAACDVEALYEHMLPKGAISSSRLNKLKDAELYQSAVTVSLGLNIPVDQLGFEEEMIFLCKEDIQRTEHNTGDPNKCGISILAPSFRDPTLAPEGKGTLTLYCYALFDQNEWGL